MATAKGKQCFLCKLQQEISKCLRLMKAVWCPPLIPVLCLNAWVLERKMLLMLLALLLLLLLYVCAPGDKLPFKFL
jgi:hypothetical protein